MFFNSARPHPLQPLSQKLRGDILNTVYQAGFGHIGGALSSLDIIIALYLSDLFDFNRDHFILSAGHLCLAHYVVLSHLGKFSADLLPTFGELSSPLS